VDGLLAAGGTIHRRSLCLFAETVGVSGGRRGAVGEWCGRSRLQSPSDGILRS
jgi:hypothetical protein